MTVQLYFLHRAVHIYTVKFYLYLIQEMDKEQLIQGQQPIHELDTPLQPTCETVTSDLIQAYEEIMGTEFMSEKEISEFISKLKSHQISYEPHYFYENIEAKIVDHMPSYQIVTLKIFYGYFACSVTLYCLQEQSCSHYLPNKESSNASTLYFAGQQPEEGVIKCYYVTNSDDYLQVFTEALKQLFLLKIAEGLGVGPKLLKHGGFDIIISKECIQLRMEKCSDPITVVNKVRMETMAKDLAFKLNIIHSFQLVHLDIKPSNIMYSHSSSQLVFIDFGLSKLIKESRGFKTKSEFAGSIGYCGPQMRKGLTSDIDSCFIDLYYNDAHSLKVALEEMNNLQEQQIKIKIYQQKDETGDQNMFVNHLSSEAKNIHEFYQQQEICKFKVMIYLRSQQIFKQMNYKKYLVIKNRVSLIEFILLFPYYEYYEKIAQIVLNTMPDKRHRAEYLRRIEFKKQKLLKNLLQHRQQWNVKHENILLNMLGIQDKQQQLFKFGVLKFCLEVNQVISIKLSDEHFIQKMSQKQYYLQAIKAVDLRSSFASLREKKQISQIFKNKMIKLKGIKTMSQNPQIEQFFKIILQLFVNMPISMPQNFQQIIPIAVLNLVILQAISADQIVNIISSVSLKVLSQVRLGLFLVRMKVITYWDLERIVNQYPIDKYYKISNKIKHIFQILQDKDKNKYSILNIFYSLINIDVKEFELSSKYILNIKELIQLNEQIKESSQQILGLIIFESFRQSKGKEDQFYLKIIIYLHQYGGIDMGQIKVLSIIHIMMLRNFSKCYKWVDKPKNNFQKIMKCFQEAEIARKFVFYYIKTQNSVRDQKQQLTQLHKDIIFLIQTYQKDPYSVISLTVMLIYNAVKREVSVKYPQISFQIMNTARQFCNETTLNKLLKCAKKTNHKIFYKNVQYFSQIFYALHPLGSPEIEKFKQFFHVFKYRDMDKSVCISCKQVYQNTVKNIDLLILLHDGKHEQGTQLCLQQVNKLIDSDKWTKKWLFLKEFLCKMVAFICNLEEQEDLIKHSGIICSLIKEMKSYSISISIAYLIYFIIIFLML